MIFLDRTHRIHFWVWLRVLGCGLKSPLNSDVSGQLSFCEDFMNGKFTIDDRARWSWTRPWVGLSEAGATALTALI